MTESIVACIKSDQGEACDKSCSMYKSCWGFCKDIDTCYKIKILQDKDMLDFQFADAVKGVCAKCSESK